MSLMTFLLTFGLSAVVVLIAGIWVVRKNNGGVKRVFGIGAVVLGALLLAIVTVMAPNMVTTTTFGSGVEYEQPKSVP